MTFRLLSVVLWLLSVAFVVYGLIAAIMAFTADASTLPLVGSLLSRPHFMDRAIVIVILVLFAWVLFELSVKLREVRRQHAAIPMFQKQMVEADQNRYQPTAFDLKRPRAIRRADLIIECSRREPSSLHEAVPAAAALDGSTLVGGYGPLNVYAWILPVLGFIGTASGMASAIDGFKDVLRGGQVQVDSLASELSQSVIPGLAAAFETTILALAAALVVYFCTSALKDWDQEALDQLDRLCIVLLSRIPQPPTPDGQKMLAVLQQISDQLREMLATPLALGNAASALGRTAHSLAASSGQFSAAADTMSRSIEGLAAASSESTSAANAMRRAAETALNSAAGAEPASRINANEDSMLEGLASAIKDLHKAVSAPIRFTISRDQG